MKLATLRHPLLLLAAFAAMAVIAAVLAGLPFRFSTTEAWSTYPMSPNGNHMAVDAISGDGVDASRTVPGTDPFDADIYITEGSTAYQGYQYTLEWDDSILAYDTATDLRPGEMYNCSTPTQQTPDSLFGGCLRSSGTTTYTGPVTTVTLVCVADGVSPLHLVTLGEDPSFGSSTIGLGGGFIATDLTDASVRCGEEPTATPTPAPYEC